VTSENKLVPRTMPNFSKVNLAISEKVLLFQFIAYTSLPYFLIIGFHFSSLSSSSEVNPETHIVTTRDVYSGDDIS